MGNEVDAAPVHQPGPVLNERPGPRVLVEVDGSVITKELAERLAEVVPTLVETEWIDRFNLNEWDCVVTSGATANLDLVQPGSGREEDRSLKRRWREKYPPHLSVFTVIQPALHQHDSHFEVLAFDPPNGESEGVPTLALVTQSGKVGLHLALPQGLPDGIERLVRRELIPVAEARQFHRTFHQSGERSPATEVLFIRPFLYGPDEEVLAGSIERNDAASLWFLPGDLPDIYPWVMAALAEWHDKYPKRFPALPDWGSTDEWRTADEVTIAAKADENVQWIHAQYKTFDERDKELTAEMEAAKSRAETYERALLTGDGRLLEEAVGCALAELGFNVVDMDEIWPEGPRKEDLRVLDPDDPSWIALVEIKGFSNGVKETGFTSLVRWGQFYVQETGTMPVASWYIANGFRRDDPAQRPDPYAGRSDALDVVEEAGGMVIDTRALFDLVRAVRQEPGRVQAARCRLRESTRLLVRCQLNLPDSASAESEATA